MLEAIEKLLILQDRDRKISRLRSELANIGPERQALAAKTASSQAALDAAKQRIKQIESDRKKLELDAESKKQAIERYSLQQFQTKKNEEYRALAHEIEMAREAIVKLEDQQLELMEQAEATQKRLSAAAKLADEAKRLADKQLADLGGRDENLKKELAALEADRDQLAATPVGLDELTRALDFFAANCLDLAYRDLNLSSPHQRKQYSRDGTD